MLFWAYDATRNTLKETCLDSKNKIPKPPPFPKGDLGKWVQEWQQYPDSGQARDPDVSKASVESAVITPEPAPNISTCNAADAPVEAGSDPQQLEQSPGPSGSDADAPEDSSDVEGDIIPLVDEGPRVMLCVEYEVRLTRYEPKIYLRWEDEETGVRLEQYFKFYKKFPRSSKAVENYIVATGTRPKRLDRISLRKLVGLRAEVFIETVRPRYTTGALAGKTKPEHLHYSKVAEILRPLGWKTKS